ncbi:MAG TPA: GAF domain-containing protein [Elusimicrobiota bacterium]|nr:GAF domain-containing protein [Elusimicrobiota bacterium]
MDFRIITIILSASLLAVIIAFYLVLSWRKQRREKRYISRLEETQGYLQEHVAKLDSLAGMLLDVYEIGMMGIGASARDAICHAILDNACKLVKSNMGSLMLVDRNTQGLKIVSLMGLPKEVMETTHLSVGDGVAGRVASTGKPIYVEDIQDDKRFLRPAQSVLESKAMCSVPMRVKNRTVGVLNVHGTSSQFLEERDIQLLQILADQSAITLENFDLRESLQAFYMEMVQTLAGALAAKDSGTHAHADRARRYARGVATELHLPEQIITYVEYAALMHDIGKIGVEDAILKKEGKLTSEEYSAMKRHPEIGSKILAPVAFLAPVASLVLYHQEWYNGQGYPEGLRGEEIPLGSRIVSIIDAWDAMTSDRPYRKALNRTEAVAELKRGAGSQFDPKVVEAFLKFLEREDKPAAATV